MSGKITKQNVSMNSIASDQEEKKDDKKKELPVPDHDTSFLEIDQTDPQLVIVTPVSVGVLALSLLSIVMQLILYLLVGVRQFAGDYGKLLYDSIVDFSFYTSLFDLIIVGIVFSVATSLVFWRYRLSASKALGTLIWVLPLLSTLYAIVKAALLWSYSPASSSADPSAVLDDMLMMVSGNSTFCPQVASGPAACIGVPVVHVVISSLIILLAFRTNRLLRNPPPILPDGPRYQKLSAEEDGEDDAEIKHSSIKRLLGLALPHMGLLVGGTLCLLISSASLLAVPQLFGTLITALSPPGDVEKLHRTIFIMIGVAAIGGVATFFRSWLFTLAGQRLVVKLRQDLYAAMLRHDVKFFDANKVGELTNRLGSDTQVLQDTITVNVSMVVRSLVQIIAIIVILFLNSWKLTLVMLAVLPVIIVIAIVYARYLKKLKKAFQDHLALSTADATEVLTSIRTVRTFVREEMACEEYNEKAQRSFKFGARAALVQGGFAGSMGILAQFAITLALWYGSTLILGPPYGAQLTPASLVTFMLYSIQLAASVGTVSSIFGQFMQAVGASERVFQLIDGEPSIPIAGGTVINKESAQGVLQVENVDFCYPSRPEHTVLKDISFELRPGKVVALVGKSGAGKSTIVQLIERFYDPNAGRISLDGVDITELDPRYYRRLIGYVKQEPILFGRSIKENILFGVEDHEAITQDELDAAARAANCYDFIMEFPDGFETEVGERGVRLSGGQKARVAIARALILDPLILLLDEATAALDSESEHLVHEAIERAMTGRATLVIAHRLSTVRNADEVLVVGSDARIVERGTHDELLQIQDGVYRALVDRQLEKANADDDIQ